jgi:hypothetical protein
MQKLVSDRLFLFYLILYFKNVFVEIFCPVVDISSTGFIEPVGEGKQELRVINEIAVGDRIGLKRIESRFLGIEKIVRPEGKRGFAIHKILA